MHGPGGRPFTASPILVSKTGAASLLGQDLYPNGQLRRSSQHSSRRVGRRPPVAFYAAVMAVRLANVTIDCTDPSRLVTFWSSVLGWTAQPDHNLVVPPQVPPFPTL